MTFIFIIALLIPLAALVERRGRGVNDRAEERIALLEGEVERLSQEVRRLEEQTEFMHRLLTERATGGSATRRDDA